MLGGPTRIGEHTQSTQKASISQDRTSRGQWTSSGRLRSPLKGANYGRGPSLSPLCGLHVCHPDRGSRWLWPSQASPPGDSGGSVSTQNLCWKGGKCPRVLELASSPALGRSWGTRSLLTGPGKGHRATGRIRPVTAARGEGGSPDKAKATGKEGRPSVPFFQPPLGVLV